MYADDLAHVHHRCVAVTAIGEVLGYHAAPPRGRSPLPRLFPRVAQALPTGGLSVFDLLVAASMAPLAYRTWQMASDWAVLVEAVENRRGGHLRRDIVTFRRNSDGFRRASERHWIRPYGRDEVTEMLKEAGFGVRPDHRT